MKLVLLGSLFALGLVPATVSAQGVGFGVGSRGGAYYESGGGYRGGYRRTVTATASASASVAVAPSGYGNPSYGYGYGYAYPQPYSYPQPFSYAYPTGAYVMSYSYPVVQSPPTVVYSQGGCGCSPVYSYQGDYGYQGGYSYGW